MAHQEQREGPFPYSPPRHDDKQSNPQPSPSRQSPEVSRPRQTSYQPIRLNEPDREELVDDTTKQSQIASKNPFPAAKAMEFKSHFRRRAATPAANGKHHTTTDTGTKAPSYAGQRATNNTSKQQPTSTPCQNSKTNQTSEKVPTTAQQTAKSKPESSKKQHNNQPIKIGMKIIATKAKEKLPATKRNCNRQIEPPTISKEYYRYNVTIMGTNPILNINNNDNSNELI